jgi:hypothetical protein
VKSLIKMSSLIFCVFTLSGCFGSIDEATQNALEACGIVKYVPPVGDSVVDENTPKNGDYVFNSEESGGFWSVTDDIKSHETRSETWKKRAVSASSAARLDSKYLVLSSASTNLSNINTQVVSVRKLMLAANSTNFSGIDWSFADPYNLELNTWRIECTGIADSLNK